MFDAMHAQSNATDPLSKSRKRWPWIVGIIAAFSVGLGAGLSVGAISGSIGLTKADVDAAEPEFSAFEQAKRTCAPSEYGYGAYVNVLADGSALDISGEGKRASGIRFQTIRCILDELGAPQSVESRIGNTRALDGTLDATWSEFTATWTYHPNAGLDMVIEYRR